MSTEVFIPKLGQTVEEVTILNWLVADGTKVDQGQEILEVETDKAVFSVTTDGKGWLHIGPYKAGDIVPVLEVVALIGAENEKFVPVSLGTDQNKTQPSSMNATTSTILTNVETQYRTDSNDQIFVSPRAKKLASEKQINLSLVKATGDEGRRITEKDVLGFLTTLPKATPVAQRIALEKGIDLRSIHGTGPNGIINREDLSRSLAMDDAERYKKPEQMISEDVLEKIPLTGVRAIISERMAASKNTTASVTLMTEIDATQLVDIRERLTLSVSEVWGFAPGYSDLLAVIVAKALRNHTYMNARMNENYIQILKCINIGMAVDTERGLLVPVVKDADKISLRQFCEVFRGLVKKAREGRLLPDELTGGTFTITNLGMYAIDGFTPIINFPECAILGVGRIIEKPVARNGNIVLRKMLTLSLVFDHRLVDGAPAARFLQYITRLAEEPYLVFAE